MPNVDTKHSDEDMQLKNSPQKNENVDIIN